MIQSHKGKTPKIHETAFVHPSAIIIGDVEIGEGSSIWPSAVLRGDKTKLKVGKHTSIQDNSTVHSTMGFPIEIGDNVTIGHNCVIHGCKIGDGTLIGMGAVILNGAEIGEESLVGASTLISQGKKFNPRSLILGLPGKVLKEVSQDQVQGNIKNADNYFKLSREYLGEE